MKKATTNSSKPSSVGKDGQLWKTKLLSRNLVLVGVVALFLLISIIFVRQYRQYSLIEDKLDAAYARNLEVSGSDAEQLYKLFNETDMVFRMFTLDFDNNTYMLYREKLDSISLFIDSLSVLSMESELIEPNTTANFEARNRYASEFAVLKKTMDELILHNEHESSPIRTAQPEARISRNRIDTLNSSTRTQGAAQTSDTLVRKRESLFRRIFKAKNDTIVLSHDPGRQIQTERLEILRDNQSTVIAGLAGQTPGNMQAIRSTFRQLQEKERLLLMTNFELLSQLKDGIDRLRLMELESIRDAESRDFSTYRENSGYFRTQLIYALVLMILMILLLIYYQRKAALWEQQLIDELDYSKKLADEKTNMLANISHEVRTPLNSLMNITEMLKSYEGNEGDKERMKLAESSYYHIQMISNTVNDILQVSKIEAGDNEDEPAADYFYNPYILLERIVSLHQSQATFKHIKLGNQYELDRKLNILGDEFRTGQILSNLIGNAIKYTGDGGEVSVTTTLQKEKDQQQLCIEVRDTGIGIDEKHQQQVFRKYYTANKTTGFGLGLYLSKRMADSMGATIQLSSKPNHGSVFTLRIPVKEARMDQQAQKPVISLQSPAIPAGIRVLTVDDNPVNLLYIKHLLKKSNVELEEASDVKTALRILKDKAIDIIITDIHLPELSGWDLLKHIKSDPALQSIGVFSMSAVLDPIAPDEASGYNFDGFLGKPINEHDLVKAILGWAGKSRD